MTSLDQQSAVLEDIQRQVALLTAEAEERRRIRETFSELTGDLSPIARQGLDSVVSAMSTAEGKGYIDFTRSGLQVVDNVVTSFTTEDIEALGQNVVLILETVKEMTQPEIMQMMRSTLHDLGDVEEPTEPPGLVAILRRMRTPEARRGLHRLVVLLESLGSSDSIKNNKEVRQ